MTPLIENGRFTIPLFHATSSFFLPSIVERGLGGINIVQETKALKLMELLCDLIEENLHDYGKDYIAKMRLIVEQRKGQRWRHGGVFITPSVDTAIRYGVNNFGSELFTLIHGHYLDVIKYIPDTCNILDEYQDVRNIFDGTHKPVLVILDDVPVSILGHENGGSGRANVEQLVEGYNLGKDMGFSHADALRKICQQVNFELLQPVKAGLSFFAIEYSVRHKLNPRYELLELEEARISIES